MALVFPNIDPVAFELGPIVIRWYALAYLTGFVGGWMMAGKLVEKYHDKTLTRDHVDDLLTWIILGVILGGRLGYVIFYNPSYYLSNPADILKVWQGGMAFHGGMLGAIVSTFLFARKYKIQFLKLTDILAVTAPIGLFFGRLANFINGELYGRITDSPFGMVFPGGGELPRHPSQLYEATLEGFVLFVFMLILIKKGVLKDKPGVTSAIFLMGYGIFRFLIEYVREPDAQIGLFLNFVSMGQILCLPMIIGGVLILKYRETLQRI